MAAAPKKYKYLMMMAANGGILPHKEECAKARGLPVKFHRWGKSIRINDVIEQSCAAIKLHTDFDYSQIVMHRRVY